MSSHSTLPTVALEGFRDAAAYDTYRPSYPETAVQTFLKNLKVTDQPDVNIVEIAAGTGKFTELLANRQERFIVKAIEPHEGMRAKLVAKDLKAVEVIDGTADKMPVGNEWGDACVTAQAFHWFSTPESLKEIRRVLRPGAVFGAIWNIEDCKNLRILSRTHLTDFEDNKPREWEASTKWEQKLNDYIWSFDDGVTRFRHLKWREIFDTQLPSNPFQVLRDTITDHLPKFSLPIGEGSEKWTVWLTADALWSRLNTLSQIAMLKGEGRENALRAFEEALQASDVERNDKGEIAVHGLTYFIWTDRL